MLGKRIGIDLGTASIRLLAKGEGMIASEPAVVAMRDGEAAGSTFGAAALEHADDDRHLELHRPIAGGAVVDPAALRVLISHAIARAVGRQRIFKPDAVIAVMSAMSGDDRRAVLEAATLAGARTVYLLDTPIAAAMGTGMVLRGANGHLVIDVGAGKTEIAVLALEGTIAGECLAGHGGARLAAAVTDHVRREHGITLRAAQAEDIIASLARVGVHEERRLDVHSRVDSRDVSVSITSTELAGCLDDHVRPIVAALDRVFADTPAALRDDIVREGGVLCGGGAQLEGLGVSLSGAAGFEVRSDASPQLCAVRGTGHALDNLDVLKRTFMYIR